MRNLYAVMLVLLALTLIIAAAGMPVAAQTQNDEGLKRSAAQAPRPRLSCEEITGGLYIANAQLAEQLRDTAAKLAEAQAELAKAQPAK